MPLIINHGGVDVVIPNGGNVFLSDGTKPNKIVDKTGAVIWTNVQIIAVPANTTKTLQVLAQDAKIANGIPIRFIVPTNAEIKELRTGDLSAYGTSILENNGDIQGETKSALIATSAITIENNANIYAFGGNGGHGGKGTNSSSTSSRVTYGNSSLLRYMNDKYSGYCDTTKVLSPVFPDGHKGTFNLTRGYGRGGAWVHTFCDSTTNQMTISVGGQFSQTFTTHHTGGNGGAGGTGAKFSSSKTNGSKGSVVSGGHAGGKGGNGGNWGEDGGNGSVGVGGGRTGLTNGSKAGNAVEGQVHITWTKKGTIKGALL